MWAGEAKRLCFACLKPITCRSIPADRIAEINRELEGDIMVRQVYTKSDGIHKNFKAIKETNLLAIPGLRRERDRHGERSGEVQGRDRL